MKLLVVSLNLLFILTYNLFFSGDVSIEQQMPESVKAGETFEIQVTIEKGDREGFAKWQQALPEGFIAEAKETEGATFSFKNQEVKLIWMAIPDKEKFTIIYTVKTDDELQGEFDVNGKFSYIEENERKDVVSPIKKIVVVSGGAVVQNSEEDLEEGLKEMIEGNEINDEGMEEGLAEMLESNESNDEGIEEGLASMLEAQDESETPEIEEMVSEKDDIKIARTIKEMGPATYEVTLTIGKGALQSFGKVEEYLPPNYIATSVQNQEGMFSFNNKIMKILWMTLPTNETIEVKYQLESTSDELEVGVIHGIFSYLDDDDSKQIEMKGTEFNNTFVSEEMAANIAAEKAAEEERVKERMRQEKEQAEAMAEAEANSKEQEVDAVEEMIGVASIEEKEVEDPIAQEIEESSDAEEEIPAEEDLVAEVTNIPAPESDIRYKVQIAAAKKEVSQQYFIDRHQIRENVTIEYHEDWYKYTLGGYDVYRQARDKRNEIWEDDNKISDAFVTAYNSGERVSVQEALMISKQKWYK